MTPLKFPRLTGEYNVFMVKNEFRYYTYKVTFKDLPGYFYYGRRKFRRGEYLGSPATWRHLWDQFEPEVQILQWYLTAEEVDAAEKSIIRATWKDKYSLNENIGGRMSEEVCRRNGKKTAEKTAKKNGKEAVSKGLGIHDPKNRGKVLESSKKNGDKVRQRCSKQVLCVETSIAYPSIEEAGRKTKVHPNNIRSSCKGRRLSAGGYHWVFIGENT